MASRRSMIGVVAGLLAVVVVAGGWTLWDNSDYRRAARELPTQIRLARAEGLALEPADLARRPAVEPTRNAADVIWALCEEIKIRSKTVNDLTAILDRKSNPKTDLPKAEAALRLCAHLFELTVQAAQRPECDFHRNYALGPSLMFPEYAGMKTAVKALAARARVESLNGNTAESWRSLEQAAVLARHSGREPSLISVLVCVACDLIVMSNAEQILISQKGSAPAIDGMRRVLKALGPVPDLHQALRGELVMKRVAIDCLRQTRDLKALLGGDQATSTRNPLASSSTACDAYEARLIGAFRRLTAALPKDMDEWRSTAKVLDKIAAEESPANKPSYLLNTMFPPIFNKALEAIAMDAARRRLCNAGAELYAFRNAHGSFPRVLPNLGADGVDIMDGKTLRYRFDGQSFVLYSVGRNQVDDGGSGPKATKYGSESLDYVFGAGPVRE